MILLIFLRFFFTSIVISRHFGPLRGLLLVFGAMALLWEPLRASLSSLPTLAILTPGLVQPPALLVKFVDLGVCQNNSAKANADGGWHKSKKEKVSRGFCYIAYRKRDEISKIYDRRKGI